MDWTFFSLLLIASFFLISLSLELSLMLELSSSNTLSAYWKKKKKRREKRLKPSNTWLVSAFVCFWVWEKSRGEIDERKNFEFLSPWNRETILINYLAYWITRLKANETIYAWFAKKEREKIRGAVKRDWRYRWKKRMIDGWGNTIWCECHRQQRRL